MKCKQHDEIRLDKDEIANCFPRNLGQVTFKKPWLSYLKKKNGISYESMWWAFVIKTSQVSLCKKTEPLVHKVSELCCKFFPVHTS